MRDLLGDPGRGTSLERIILILLLAFAAHLLVLVLRRAVAWVLAPEAGRAGLLQQRYPKVGTLVILVVSALTFVIYFGAIGLILNELGVSLTAYLASASVIGLAVAFGSQGLVQDVVTGLTLIFSDVLVVGDMVDISGQSGKVQKIGLRFTTLVNLLEQRVFIPNRSITQINRYSDGGIRAFVDVQLPSGADERQILDALGSLAGALRAQFGGIVLADPKLLGVRTLEPAGYRAARLEFRLWPGQGALLENAFAKRVAASMRALDPDYADWMINVTYRPS